MNELMTDMMDVSAALDLIHPSGFAFVIVILAIFFVAKIIFDLATPFKLNEELTARDNKAVALSFAGYIVGVGLIIYSVVSGDPLQTQHSGIQALSLDLISTFVWGLGGIVFLIIARIVNDKFILSKFNINKELVTDRNLGTGAVEFGSFVGSGLIIQAALSGEETGVASAVLSAIVFFILGQFCFVLFGRLFQKIVRFDLHKEIEEDNASAGVSFGLNLIAVAILLSEYIKHSDSIIGLFAWFVLSSIILISCRYMIDKLLLPGALLDEEISQDRNWGAALVEGFATIVLAFVVTGAFF